MNYLTGARIGEMNTLTRALDDFHGLEWVFAGNGHTIVLSENGDDCCIGLGDFTVTNTLQQYLSAHREAITALAISSDGRVLATGAGLTPTRVKSVDNSVRLWEVVPSFRSLGELTGHEGWIAGLRFAPDGRTLASGGADQTVRLWDVPSRTLKWASRRLSEAVMRVCFSPDGQTLFSGTSDGQIQRWSLDTPLAERRFSRRAPGFEAMAINPLGDRLAGVRQGGVYLAGAHNLALGTAIPELGTNNRCLLFSGDGQFLFAGTMRGQVQIWSLVQHRLLRRLESSPEPVWGFRQDAAGHRLLVTHCDAWIAHKGRPCSIGIWQVTGTGTDWRQEKSLVVSGYRLAFDLSPDGHWLATGDPSAPVRVWNLEGATATQAATFDGGTLTELAFSPDGRLLAAGNEEGMVRIWEILTLRELSSFRAHNRLVRTLTFSPDNRRLATAGDGDEAVKLWDVATWEELISLECPGESLKQLAFRADGNELVARNSEGDVVIWRVPSFAEIEAKENRQTKRK